MIKKKRLSGPKTSKLQDAPECRADQLESSKHQGPRERHAVLDLIFGHCGILGQSTERQGLHRDNSNIFRSTSFLIRY